MGSRLKRAWSSTGKLKWLEAYYKELRSKPDMGEIEWRSCFIDYVVKKGLGYPSKLVRNEKGHTDVRILTHDNISHIVFETKISGSDLDKPGTGKNKQVRKLCRLQFIKLFLGHLDVFPCSAC